MFVCVFVSCVFVFAACLRPRFWQGYDEKVRYARLLSGVRRRQERPGAAGAELLKVRVMLCGRAGGVMVYVCKCARACMHVQCLVARRVSSVQVVVRA